jgi:hypothetical protein
LQSKYPLVVMHLADVPDVEISFMHTAGIRTLEIDSIPNPNCKANKSGSRPCARGRDNYSKLALFHLTQFRCVPLARLLAASSLHRRTARTRQRRESVHTTVRLMSPAGGGTPLTVVRAGGHMGMGMLFVRRDDRTLVYMDCDMVATQNIDELFCKGTFACAKIVFPPCTGVCTKLNSGIMVVQPDEKIYQDMLSRYATTKSYNSGDQGFLSTYFAEEGAPPIEYLDGSIYNFKIKQGERAVCPDDLAERFEQGTAGHVVHFMDANKPWTNVRGREDLLASALHARVSSPCFKKAWSVWFSNYLGGLDLAPDVDKYLAGDLRICARRKDDPMCAEEKQQEEQEGHGHDQHSIDYMRWKHHMHGGGHGGYHGGGGEGTQQGDPKYMLQPGDKDREAPPVKASVVIMNW